MKNRIGVNSKVYVALLAAVLVIGCAVGGTVAWLTARSGEVVNSFTYGDINIELSETTGNDYTILPGNDIEKDPKVTVKADSEKCWLFVKIDESGTFIENKVTWETADGWNPLQDQPGVYYREVDATTEDTEFFVLKNNKIIVSRELTKQEVNSVTTPPVLTFTAYAVQYDKSNTGSFRADEAWQTVNAELQISEPAD